MTYTGIDDNGIVESDAASLSLLPSPSIVTVPPRSPRLSAQIPFVSVVNAGPRPPSVQVHTPQRPHSAPASKLRRPHSAHHATSASISFIDASAIHRPAPSAQSAVVRPRNRSAIRLKRGDGTGGGSLGSSTIGIGMGDDTNGMSSLRLGGVTSPHGTSRDLQQHFNYAPKSESQQIATLTTFLSAPCRVTIFTRRQNALNHARRMKASAAAKAGLEERLAIRATSEKVLIDRLWRAHLVRTDAITSAENETKKLGMKRAIEGILQQSILQQQAELKQLAARAALAANGAHASEYSEYPMAQSLTPKNAPPSRGAHASPRAGASPTAGMQVDPRAFGAFATPKPSHSFIPSSLLIHAASAPLDRTARSARARTSLAYRTAAEEGYAKHRDRMASLATSPLFLRPRQDHQHGQAEVTREQQIELLESFAATAAAMSHSADGTPIPSSEYIAATALEISTHGAQANARSKFNPGGSWDQTATKLDGIAAEHFTTHAYIDTTWHTTKQK
jgi:hypothetical protein